MEMGAGGEAAGIAAQPNHLTPGKAAGRGTTLEMGIGGLQTACSIEGEHPAQVAVPAGAPVAIVGGTNGGAFHTGDVDRGMALANLLGDHTGHRHQQGEGGAGEGHDGQGAAANVKRI